MTKLQIILFGPPGAGKGTQAAFICEHFHIPTFLPADMLRKAVTEGTALGTQAQNYMQQGHLVPDQLMIDLIKERITETDCDNGFLLDGFPQTLPQADALHQAKVAITHVVKLVVPDEEIIRRAAGRLVHPGSGRVYNILSILPPQHPGLDDVTGEPLIQRDDDKRRNSP